MMHLVLVVSYALLTLIFANICRKAWIVARISKMNINNPRIRIVMEELVGVVDAEMVRIRLKEAIAIALIHCALFGAYLGIWMGWS